MQFEKVSYVFEEIEFELYRTELSIPIPKFNRELLTDADIAIQTRLDSQPKHVSSVTPLAPDDVHIYIDKTDVTKAYLTSLGKLVDAQPPDELGQRYLDAMMRFLDYAEVVGNYEALIPPQRKIATQLAATRPLSRLIDKLGNATQGHNGHLHLCNFLHGSLGSYEVSLVAIINEYNRINAAAPIDPGQAKIFTISSGPSIALDRAAWPRPAPTPRGAVAISVNFHFHDPLVEEIDALKKQLQRIQDELTDAIQAIKDALGTNGLIRRTIARIDTSTDASLREVQASRLDLQSQQVQLHAQETTLQEIKKLVEGL